jgi:LuxR family transcriptional regulator, maltose regulon positive regulatory protein
VCPGAGADSLQAPAAPGENTREGVLTSLINDLAGAPARLTLVIDDFHLITNEEIKRNFAFLVDHLPVTLGLVVATRHDPDLPLARMRARGELAEFRAEDLRFTEAETADLLNRTLGLGLPPEDVHAVRQRTEAWAAGLYLAGLSLRGREDVTKVIAEITGVSRQIDDYFAAEVLAGLAPEVRSFLLRTSVLDGWCGPLCDAVAASGESGGSQALLEELEQAQLFLVPMDTTRSGTAITRCSPNGCGTSWTGPSRGSRRNCTAARRRGTASTGRSPRPSIMPSAPVIWPMPGT